MMWFPELFNRFNEFSKAHPGEPATICGVTDFYVARMDANSDGDACSDDIAGSVFLESLITVAAAVPSNIFAVLGIDRLGRKFYLGTTLILLTSIMPSIKLILNPKKFQF